MRDARRSPGWRRVAILFLIAGLAALRGGAVAGDPPAEPTAAPQITATAPAADATGVPLNSAIQVRFSESMDPASAMYSIVPTVLVAASWPTTDILVLTPDPPGLVNCTAYSVQVSGTDLDEGLSLVPGGARNPWSFATVCDRPYVTQTVPADGARDVAPDAPIVVTYSEPMDPVVLSFRLNPATGSLLTTWDGTRSVLTVSTSLQPGTRYTATALGRDVDGNPLVASFVPNPWTFTVNAPPSVTGFNVSRGGCLESGSIVSIDWSMADDTDAAVDLSVRVAYRDGAAWVPVLGPATGFPSPASYPWTLPVADLDTRLRIEVNDTAGATASAETSVFRIDSAPPRVLSTSPADGTTGIPVQTSVVVLFSEPMDVVSTEAAVSIAPSTPTPTFQWANGNTSLAIALSGLLDRTPYAVTIEGTARDACGAGHPMGADRAFGFTTARVASRPPTGLRTTSSGDSWVELAWDPVTTFVTGTSIPASSAIAYRVFRSETGTPPGTLVAETAQARVRDEGLRASTNYTYWVVAVVDGEPSADSGPVRIATQPPVFATPMGWIAVAIPIAVAGIVAVLFLRRRRGARDRAEDPGGLLDEVRAIGGGLLRAREEPDPGIRARLLGELRVRYLATLPSSERNAPRGVPASAVYETLARTLAGAPAVSPSQGDSLLRSDLGPMADQLGKFPAAYAAMRDAEAAMDALPDLPDYAGRALLLERVRGLEEYLGVRIAALAPDRGGAVRRVSRRSHGTRSAGLLGPVDRDPKVFLSRPGDWPKARARIHEALALRARLEDLDAEPPTPDRTKEAVFAALTACRGLFPPTGSPEGSGRRT